MKDLLLYIARNLVDDPEAVSVTEIQGDQELTLELRVAPDDMGKVIGSQGGIAKELRSVIRSYAQRTGVKVSVDIVDKKRAVHRTALFCCSVVNWQGSCALPKNRIYYIH